MNTDANEKQLALAALRGVGASPEEKDRVRDEYEKRMYGPYPAGNRHERRKARKLARSKR